MRQAGRLGIALATLFAALHPASAQPAAARPAVDYAPVASWLCRPDDETICTTGLDAIEIDAQGQRAKQPFTPAADAPIDCFYVYPTASEELTAFSDMTATPAIKKVTSGQVGRLTAQCRMFAPIYRQLTSAGLTQMLMGGKPADWSDPYADVLAAWRWYLAHENKGRGVVLIGHSQGTILLQRLIAEEIDGKPAQARLVAAFLAGDPSLPVPKGANVGGVFKHVPICAAAGQTGCAYVWGSYLADDPSPVRAFGKDAADGEVAACANPAAPGGGSGALKTYLPKPAFAPANDPPWIALKGQLSGACVADAGGNVLRVTIEPGRYAGLLAAALSNSARTGWGLHRLDLNLTQGNIADVIEAETSSWTKKTP
jgi:hypothetical protein